MKAPHQHRANGFTLVETMVACAIGTVVLGGICSTYIIATRGFMAISNYRELHTDGRLAIDVLGRDLRAVSQVTSCNPSNIVVIIPTAFSSSGNVISNKTLTYSLLGGALFRADSETAKTSRLVTNLYNQNLFTLYDKLGSNTTVTSVAKGIQIELKFRKNIVSQIQSEDFLSARLDMRNVP